MSDDTTQLSALLDGVSLAHRRGLSPKSLAVELEGHRLFCLTVDGEQLYPAFFADKRFGLRQLAAITKTLGTASDGDKWLFFTTPKGSLGGVSPLRALLDGRFAEVQAAARGYAER